MTATDELRRMLDERGVEWGETRDGSTAFSNADGRVMWAIACGAAKSFFEVGPLTPAQAIATTLGRGSCKVVSKPCDMWECECGKAWWHGGAPNYCPNCGRKVVQS